MRKPIVAANWKMNGNTAQVRSLLEGFRDGIQREDAEFVVFAPFVFIPQVQAGLTGTSLQWGAQNIYPADAGAYTGEVSVPMLKEFGCSYVLAGHSERRSLFGETNDRVADKVEAILAGGLTPMLCIGETLEEREAGRTMTVLERQLQSVLDRVGVPGFRQTVIAYEPVWAIGTGHTASPEQAQETHADLREFLRRADADMADNMALLYGGSVKAASAPALFAQPDIDGGLVGGAALDVNEFVGICDALSS